MKKKIIPLLFIGLLLLGLLVVAGLGYYWYEWDSKPVQPIAYSHYLHLEKVGLECADCHQYADMSPRAGIPDMQLCAECHESVAADRPEVKKLMEYWNNKEPIPWVKVHNLDWHVRFTHKRHIKAGVDCAVCHGDMRGTDTARKVRSFDMGFCVNCHRENKAPTDCLVCHK